MHAGRDHVHGGKMWWSGLSGAGMRLTHAAHVLGRWEDRFAGVEGMFREYCAQLGDFKKNQHNR